jgi:ankyrin repeat protein
MYNNNNNQNITLELISAGADVNFQNKNGYTALMIGNLQLYAKKG